MIKQFTFNHFEVNTYVVVDEQTKQCAIVDPACEASFEDAQLFEFVETFHETSLQGCLPNFTHRDAKYCVSTYFIPRAALILS